MRKGQAGLDFLMTYGWALLIIVLVIGALFALGIFDIGSFLGSKTSGFAQVGVIGYKLTSGGVLTAQFENHVAADINVTSITATLGTETINYSTSFNIDNGEKSSTITIGTFSNPGSAGSSYSIEIELAYIDTATGFDYKDSGTVTGKVV